MPSTISPTTPGQTNQGSLLDKIVGAFANVGTAIGGAYATKIATPKAKDSTTKATPTTSVGGIDKKTLLYIGGGLIAVVAVVMLMKRR